MEERWLPVAGLEGKYEVSDQGRVQSLDRIVPTSYGRTRRSPGRVLKPSKRSGYDVVALGGRTRYVHDLVLEAFVGPKPAGCQVRHGPLGCRVNTLANLCYGTPSENAYDKWRDGTHPQFLKKNCPKGHPYDGERTRRDGVTYRFCRRCNNERQRSWWYANKRAASTTVE